VRPVTEVLIDLLEAREKDEFSRLKVTLAWVNKHRHLLRKKVELNACASCDVSMSVTERAKLCAVTDFITEYL